MLGVKQGIAPIKRAFYALKLEEFKLEKHIDKYYGKEVEHDTFIIYQHWCT